MGKQLLMCFNVHFVLGQYFSLPFTVLESVVLLSEGH
jgi:hypothetical protein